MVINCSEPLDHDGYPTEEALGLIENYDMITNDYTFVPLIEFIREIWHWDSYFKLTGKRVLKLQLHTGGWSGNEEIVAALMKTPIFWSLCWVKSERGGHYYFEIVPIKRNQKET